MLTLIRAHALLHQASRRRDADGRLVAEVADYAAVRELVAEFWQRGGGGDQARGTGNGASGCENLLADGRDEVKQADIKKALKLDKSVVSRRVAAAVDAGVLRNLEDRKGRPTRLVLGDPLPKEIELLPKPRSVARLHGCRAG